MNSRVKELDEALLKGIREEIEKIVDGYCDGGWGGIEKAHFIEYYSNGRKGPAELVDDVVAYISRKFQIGGD
jgi:hypothetical protein